MLGIGNELKGDDAAGLLAVRDLKKRLSGLDWERVEWLMFETGLAPESFSGPLRRYGAGLVLMVDAASMGELPGVVRLLDWRESSGFGPSTHLQPLSTLAEFLTLDLGCQVAVLGIQPAQLEFGEPLSVAVEGAVAEVAAGLLELIGA